MRLPNGMQFINDEVLTKFVFNGFVASKRSLMKGFYLFLPEVRQPTIVIEGINDKFYLIAKAICIIEIKGEILAHLAEFNITTLISSLSWFINPESQSIKGSRVYTQIDDFPFQESKTKYANNYIINNLVEVTKAEKPNEVTWRFINSNEIPFINSDIKLTDNLKEFLKDESLKSFIFRTLE